MKTLRGKGKAQKNKDEPTSTFPKNVNKGTEDLDTPEKGEKDERDPMSIVDSVREINPNEEDSQFDSSSDFEEEVSQPVKSYDTSFQKEIVRKVLTGRETPETLDEVLNLYLGLQSLENSGWDKMIISIGITFAIAHPSLEEDSNALLLRGFKTEILKTLPEAKRP